MIRLLLLVVLTACRVYGQAEAPASSTSRAFAATVNPYATDAALAAIREGGNAVDGAIAAAATLGVVDSHNSGIGGGLFMLIRKPDGTFVAIDGREMAPSAAKREMFLKDGKADVRLSQEGPLASGVPGWLAALDRAAKDFGKRPLSEAFTRAAQLADEGFVPDPGFEVRRTRNREAIERHPATAAIFLQPLTDGKLRMQDLAASYRSIAEHGAGWFYNGVFAAETESWMSANGGIMTTRDFARYRVKLREPLRTTY